MPSFSFLWGLWAFAVLVEGQPGFISIDCGMGEDSGSYKDEVTHIPYDTDTKFIDSGENRKIPRFKSSYHAPDQFANVRYFPSGSRNCYTIQGLEKSRKYLIRASFMYGNYDEQEIFPQFDLYLGANRWDGVVLKNESQIVRKEIIAFASLDFASVCLVNTDHGTPFISVLELRLLDNAMYPTGDKSQPPAEESDSLILFGRWDLGGNSDDIRYAIDVYDRIWSTESSPEYEAFASSDIITNNTEDFQPPSAVVRTAVRPRNGTNVLYFNWTANDTQSQFLVFMHFAEIERLGPNQVREFNVCCGGCDGPHRPTFLVAITRATNQPLTGQDRYSCFVHNTPAATLPPLLNAIEIFKVRKPIQRSTHVQDVEALMDLKAEYDLKRDWVGDPCVPSKYCWTGLMCASNSSGSPRITYINLTSSGLSGEIAAALQNLTALAHLDLSGNNLTGEIPDFFADLPELTYLNLANNKLTGSVPVNLLEKSKRGSLQLRVENNSLCESSCQGRGKRLILITALVPSSVAALLIALIVLWRYREGRKRAMDPLNEDGSLLLDARRFTYAEVVSMTNDFQRVIGKGGFGTVYHGCMKDGTQVAVKMLSQSSASKASNLFRTEAHLLMRVHHRNLASFMGYCEEGPNMALVYEYMAEGNLAENLSGKNPRALSWEERLRIALDAAQGLEYLHTGCKPPIVHRDVKTANILLNERLEAKISDFGLSKAFPTEGLSHVSTNVVGTTGYVDPEYYITNKLNEKSDVYGFGVVLLELITGKPAIIKSPDPVHIVQWAGPIISRGDIRNVIDPRLKENYDINSVWKAAEVAIACIPSTSIQRVTMNDVVIELKECVAIEAARERTWSLETEQLENKSSGSFGTNQMDEGSDSGPQPR